MLKFKYLPTVTAMSFIWVSAIAPVQRHQKVIDAVSGNDAELPLGYG